MAVRLFSMANSWRVSKVWRAALWVAAGYLAMVSSDPDPLQDFCVGVAPGSSGIFINGLLCKNPDDVIPADFKSDLLLNAANTSNGLGSNVTIADALTFPGLNMQGVTLARIDFAPNYGLNPPHLHARASEILWVAQGTLYVGFVDTNYTLYAQTLTAGEITVFPRGTVHFQINLGSEPALAFASFASQNPGVLHIPQALFAASPPIRGEVLEVGFGIDQDVVDLLVKSVASTLVADLQHWGSSRLRTQKTAVM